MPEESNQPADLGPTCTIEPKGWAGTFRRPIGDIPPAEAEEAYYQQHGTLAQAA